MEKFRDFLEEIEEEKLNKELLNEEPVTVIGGILGYTTLALLLAFGGTLIIAGGVKAVKFLRRWWGKIIKEIKDIGRKQDPIEVSKDLRRDPLVRQEQNKIENSEKKYEDELKELNIAIMNKDWDEAKAAFSNLSPTTKNLPEVKKIVMLEITKSIGEPPLYVVSPGNQTYKIMKQILGIRIARAAAEATKLSLEKKLEK